MRVETFTYADSEPDRSYSTAPKFQARHIWSELERPYIGRYRQVGAPYMLDDLRPDLRHVPPTLGEHTRDVLAEVYI